MSQDVTINFESGPEGITVKLSAEGPMKTEQAIVAMYHFIAMFAQKQGLTTEDLLRIARNVGASTCQPLESTKN